MSNSSTQILALGQKYLKKAFGDNIKFKRQSSGNPAERLLKACCFDVEIKPLKSEIQQDTGLTSPSLTPTKVNIDETTSQGSAFLNEVFGLIVESKEENLETCDNPVSSETDDKLPLDKNENKVNKGKSCFVVLPGSSEGAKEAPRFNTKESGFKRPHEYDEEYDRGKLPKIRTQARANAAAKFKAPNQFQKEQDFRNLLSSHKKNKHTSKK